MSGSIVSLETGIKLGLAVIAAGSLSYLATPLIVHAASEAYPYFHYYLYGRPEPIFEFLPAFISSEKAYFNYCQLQVLKQAEAWGNSVVSVAITPLFYYSINRFKNLFNRKSQSCDETKSVAVSNLPPQNNGRTKRLIAELEKSISEFQQAESSPPKVQDANISVTAFKRHQQDHNREELPPEQANVPRRWCQLF